MKNVMNINGYKAVIAYDPEIDMFRGEFVELNGGADFYAADLAGLRHEGAESLRVFLEECKRHGINPARPLRVIFPCASPLKYINRHLWWLPQKENP